MTTPLSPLRLIAALLGNHRPAWPYGDDPVAAENVVSLCHIHGVCALAHSRLSGLDWPRTVTDALKARTLQRAMWELRHQQVLRQTLDALAAVGATPILIKGSALAYSLYADPALRSRGDTDLLLPPGTLRSAESTLVNLGYVPHGGMRGEFISYQASFTLTATDRTAHTLDVHWKINNSQVLGRLFHHGELRGRAHALPPLGPHAWGPSPVDAMLIACMHRATHRQNPYYINDAAHHDANRLIWLYDIDLLARSFHQAQWHELCGLARTKGLRAVCLDGLQQAMDWFGSPCPQEALAALEVSARAEKPARYLSAGPLGQQWMDLWALDSASQRLRYVRELLAPPADYMLQKYRGQPGSRLPWLYLRRATSGFLKRAKSAAAAWSSRP